MEQQQWAQHKYDAPCSLHEHDTYLVGLNRSSLNYRLRRPEDSLLRQRLRELAAERRGFGYRRLGWLLDREDHVLNRKKVYRLYREEKLMVRRRRGCKARAGNQGADDATRRDPANSRARAATDGG